MFVATFPVSPVLQVPYAESLNLLLLAAALLLVVERRYLWAMPVVVLMCLSRPTGVPFAATVGLLFLYRAVAVLLRRPRTRPRGGPRRAGGGAVRCRCRTAAPSSGRWPG